MVIALQILNNVMSATSNNGLFGGIYIIISADLFVNVARFSCLWGYLACIYECGDKKSGLLRKSFGALDIGVTLHA